MRSFHVVGNQFQDLADTPIAQPAEKVELSVGVLVGFPLVRSRLPVQDHAAWREGNLSEDKIVGKAAKEL